MSDIEAEKKLVYIDLDNLEPTYTQETNPNRMSEEEFAALIAFIKSEGSLQTLLVTPKGKTKKFEIRDGHHRFWAAQQLGLTKLPCLVVPKYSKPKAHAVGIGLNNIRGNINLSVASEMMSEIMAETQWNVDQMSTLTGFAQSEIEAITKTVNDELDDVLEEVAEASAEEEIELSTNAKPFVLEITFKNKEDYKLAKRKLKKAAGKGSNDLAAGLMAVLGEEESE